MSVGQWIFLAGIVLLIGAGLLLVIFHDRMEARMVRNVLRREQELNDAGVHWPGDYHPAAGIPPSNAAGGLMIMLGLIFLAMFLLSE